MDFGANDNSWYGRRREFALITVVLPISRQTYLRAVFNCLAELEKPEDTELLIITDGDESLTRSVDRRLDSINFKRIMVVKYGDKPGEDIESRRWRIAAIHNKAKHYISKDCEYVFLAEDDTVYPADTLTKMLSVFDTSDKLGFVQGVEVGRRKTPYVGAWLCDDVANPKVITSIIPNEEWLTRRTISVIDAGGLYCALVEANLYKQHTFEPFDKVGKNGLSCDLNFGLWIRNKNRTVCIDWSIQCDHIGDKGSVNLGNTKPVQVVFEKFGNRWEAHTKV